ncbi:C-5 cytosine-specific DNA methylase [compost metagenome]
MENVHGNAAALSTIDKLMGVGRIVIDSSLVSAQNRKRCYWFNWQAEQPKYLGIQLKDILERGIPVLSKLTPGRLKWLSEESGKKCLASRYATLDPIKANCLTARSDASWNSNYVTREGIITRLTPVEYERLQTLPDAYTATARITERYKMIGNGWTVDVIKHLLESMPLEDK